MPKVKVFNLKEMVETKWDGAFTSHVKEIAIIDGLEGSIVSDDEAVHQVFKTDADKFHLDVYPNDGKMHMFPVNSVELPLSFIKVTAPCRDIELTEFVRHFGRRIEGNYATLLKSIKEIGLNPKNYKREVEHA